MLLSTLVTLTFGVHSAANVGLVNTDTQTCLLSELVWSATSTRAEVIELPMGSVTTMVSTQCNAETCYYHQNYTRYRLLTRRSGRASRHSQISPNSGGGEEKLIAFVMIDDKQRSPKRLSLIYVVWAIIYGNGRLLSVDPFSNIGFWVWTNKSNLTTLTATNGNSSWNTPNLENWMTSVPRFSV